MAKVAVVTRTKDRPLLLRRCIESVLAQNFGDWVHVIVNDGGDRAEFNALMDDYASDYAGRLKIIHNDVSEGMQNASNIAIRNSASEYIAIHDDDDSWDPEFLNACVAHLESGGDGKMRCGVATQVIWVFERIDSNGFVTELSRQSYFPFNEVSLFEMAGRNRFPPIAFVYRRSVHDEIGYFDQEFNEVGDWDFHLRFLMKHDIDVIDRELALYHWRHDSDDENYGNTVTTGLEKHLANDLKLRNHYLREDLAAQQMGLGFLINISRSLKEEVEVGDVSGGAANQEMRSILENLIISVEHFKRICSDLDRIWKFKCIVMQILLYLKRRIRLACSKPPEPASARRCRVRARLEGAARDAEILSVDVFDTAIVRSVFRPIDVFLSIQEEARSIVGDDRLDFAAMRREAEHGAREDNYSESGLEDIGLDAIYDRLCELAEIDPQHKDRLMKLEMEAERRYCSANPEILALCREAQKRDKQVVFTSDMYLPKEFVLDLLREKGYSPDDLLISSAVGKTKHSGRLFELFCKQYDCDPGRVLHIGDNHHSDSVQAQAQGLRDFHYDAEMEDSTFAAQSRFAATGEYSVSDSIFAGLARRRLFSKSGAASYSVDLFERVGYEVIGPVYLSFVAWVARQAMEKGVEKLFFLARDGYHLVRVFERLKERWGLPIDSEYMLSSRRLINFPRISQLDTDSLAFLMTPNPGMQVKHFLQRIGIDPIQHIAEIQHAGFASPDEGITTSTARYRDRSCRLRMATLLKSLEGEILSMAARERETLFQYFDDISFKPNHIAAVDVGWQASSVKSLQDLLHLRGEHCRLQGFYFGTWHFAQAAIDAGARIDSFFMHLDKPAEHRALIAESVELFESFFWAPHATITGIEKRDGDWHPLCGERELPDAMDDLVAKAVACALEFVDDALEIFERLDEVGPSFKYLEAVFERLFRNPSPAEARELGRLAHRTGFGGYGPVRHIARLPGTRDMLFKFNVLQEAYEHSFWKNGFLVQLYPREAVRLSR